MCILGHGRLQQAIAAHQHMNMSLALLHGAQVRCHSLHHCAGLRSMSALPGQATVTTTRTSDETFRVEMTGAVGGKVLAFDVAVALHA